jgi:hypothetical protein
MHKQFSVRRNLGEEQSRLPTLEHAPFASDLDPSDSFLFPELQNALKEHTSSIIDNILKTAVTYLKQSHSMNFPRIAKHPKGTH